MSLEKLQFEPNVPQCIALKFPTGKLVEGRFGDQIFFTLAQPAETCLYLDKDHAAQINALGLRRNEPFWLCKRWSGKRNDKPVFEAWTDAGEPPPAPSPAAVATGIPDTDLEQRLRASLADIERRKASAGVSAPALVAAAPEPSRQQTPPHINGNGSTNGAPRPYEAAGIPAPASPLVKIPMDVAFGQILGWMKAQLEANHIQWNDAAQQDLVSTALIGGMREGWVTIWRRGVQGGVQ